MTGLAYFIGSMIIGWVGAEIVWQTVWRARIQRADKDLTEALDQLQDVMSQIAQRSEPK